MSWTWHGTSLKSTSDIAGKVPREISSTGLPPKASEMRVIPAAVRSSAQTTIAPCCHGVQSVRFLKSCPTKRNPRPGDPAILARSAFWIAGDADDQAVRIVTPIHLHRIAILEREAASLHVRMVRRVCQIVLRAFRCDSFRGNQKSRQGSYLAGQSASSGAGASS